MKRLIRTPVWAAVFASAALAVAPAAHAGDLVISLAGDCPGVLTLEWSGADPNRRMGGLFADRLGQSRIPVGQPCGGTRLDLPIIDRSFRILMIVDTGPDGAGGVQGYANGFACGG